MFVCAHSVITLDLISKICLIFHRRKFGSTTNFVSFIISTSQTNSFIENLFLGDICQSILGQFWENLKTKRKVFSRKTQQFGWNRTLILLKKWKMCTNFVKNVSPVKIQTTAFIRHLLLLFSRTKMSNPHSYSVRFSTATPPIRG